MKIHNLKIDKDVILLKYARIKNWEIRYDDRGYQAGDILYEREFNRNTNEYGDDVVVEKIISVLPREAEYGLQENFRILITQPLYYGSYEEIKDFIGYGDECLRLVSWVAKALTLEDYLVWDKLPQYDWKSIYNFLVGAEQCKLSSFVKRQV